MHFTTALIDARLHAPLAAAVRSAPMHSHITQRHRTGAGTDCAVLSTTTASSGALLPAGDRRCCTVTQPPRWTVVNGPQFPAFNEVRAFTTPGHKNSIIRTTRSDGRVDTLLIIAASLLVAFRAGSRRAARKNRPFSEPYAPRANGSFTRAVVYRPRKAGSIVPEAATVRTRPP